MILWRIYYADGSTVSDVESTVDAVGTRGVQVIAQYHPEAGRELLCKHDYYWWTGSRWFGGDQFGLYDYLASPGMKKVVFGRTVPTEVFGTIVKKAADDPELPLKTAKLQTERV